MAGMMRQEILTGVERRRRWSRKDKLRILSEVGVEGASVSDVARRHDVTRQHLYQWRRELRRKQPTMMGHASLVRVDSSARRVVEIRTGVRYPRTLPRESWRTIGIGAVG